MISEVPSGKGFGKAAKALSKNFRMRVAPEDAKILKTISVDVPFRFRDPAQPDGRKLMTPNWIVSLTPEGMSLIFPNAARKAGVNSGVGVVNCLIDGGGRLIDCEVQRENPAGLDFGAAAIQAAQVLTMNPWTKEGDPVEGLRITLPVRFDLAPEPPPAKP